MTATDSYRLPDALAAEIHECGYFPHLVIDSVALALGGEQAVAHLVHHEATFNSGEIQRHLSVLVLTASRLLVSHTDEASEPGAEPQAMTTTESVPLRRLTSVALSQVVTHPEQHPGRPGQQITETWLAASWGAMTRIDLEPAGCSDPNCEADHGYTGVATGEDLTVRISEAGDGEAKVSQLIAFASALQQATSR